MPAPLAALPIIDISPFFSPDSTQDDRKATASRVHSACVSAGFFYLTGHGISENEMDEVLILARQFFDLALEDKEKLSIACEDMARGELMCSIVSAASPDAIQV